MRLDELTRGIPFDPDILQSSEKHYTNFYRYGDPSTLYQTLQGIGWKRIGSGAYSQVFSNPDKPYIIKANINPDRAFAWFVLLTRKFPSPHFPRVGNMKVFKGADKHSYYIYLIEKLETIPHTRQLENLTMAMSKIAKYGWTAEQTYNNTSPFYRNYEAIDPDLEHALLDLFKHKPKQFRVDIHYENVMRRSDGTIVIIDPFAD